MAVRKKAVVIQKECVACGCCVKVCKRAAIRVEHGLYAQIDPAICIGCGKCEKVCPASVIIMEVA